MTKCGDKEVRLGQHISLGADGATGMTPITEAAFARVG